VRAPAHRTDAPNPLPGRDATEVIADRPLLSSKPLGWEGVVVARWRHPFYEFEAPASPFVLVDVHVARPLSVGRDRDGRSRERLFRPGEVTILPPGRPGGVYRWSRRHEALNLSLDPALIRSAAEALGADPDRVELQDVFGARDPHVEWIARTLEAEAVSGGQMSAIYAESLATALAVRLLRRHSSLADRGDREPTRGPQLSPAALRRATDYVEDNLAGHLRLAELAAVANASPYHFARLFREATGTSPHRYVIGRRVERAKDLLLGTDLSVLEVARRCGFAHGSHLARHMRRLLDLTPTDLRR